MWQRKKARAKAEEITGVKIANERCSCGPDSSVKPLFRHRDTIFKMTQRKKLHLTAQNNMAFSCVIIMVLIKYNPRGKTVYKLA
jgi:hypothetical protein